MCKKVADNPIQNKGESLFVITDTKDDSLLERLIMAATGVKKLEELQPFCVKWSD